MTKNMEIQNLTENQYDMVLSYLEELEMNNIIDERVVVKHNVQETEHTTKSNDTL